MTWSKAIVDGFLFAASIAGDRGAEQGVRGLDGHAIECLQALRAKLDGLSTPERRAAIHAIGQRLQAPIDTLQATLPPRALALIAPLATGALGRAWLANTPAPRAGYRAEPGLRRVLRNVAEHGTWRP